jgi:hypothetical protein
MLRADGDPELRVFDPAIRFLHWLTLFLIATIFGLAFSVHFASSGEAARSLVQMHRSFGVIVWVVTLGRLVWRQFSRFPDWPADIPQPMRLDPRASPHKRARRTREPVLPRRAAGADRPRPAARQAAPGSAPDGRVHSPQPDCAARFGSALSPSLAPGQHTPRHGRDEG